MTVSCKCFFCVSNLPHPKSHTSFGATTGILKRAESLDPKDIIRLIACDTCGHTKEA